MCQPTGSVVQRGATPRVTTTILKDPSLVDHSRRGPTALLTLRTSREDGLKGRRPRRESPRARQDRLVVVESARRDGGGSSTSGWCHQLWNFTPKSYFDDEAINNLDHHSDIIVDHIDHVCQLAGNCSHSAIGSDLEFRGAVASPTLRIDGMTIAGA